MCFHGAAFLHSLVRLVHIVVNCEKMYDVQLSSQILFSQLHVRSFKSSRAAVEWFIIVGLIQYVRHKCIQFSFIYNHFVGWPGRM